jgi:integrase
MGKAHKLNALKVEKLSKPGLYGDGAGLCVRVTDGGSKHWILRYMLDGKARWMGLGSYSDFSLLDARDKATTARRMLRDGIDPLEEKAKRDIQRKIEKAKMVTFQHCADTYIKTHRSSWKNAKHADQWTSTIATYCAPIFGGLPVAEVDTPLILKALQPIWTIKHETALRLRGRIESILDAATAQGFRQGENPARWSGHLENLLANISRNERIEHHPALPFEEISVFMLELQQQHGIAAQAAQFAILTAARSGEVRGATWAEIDLNERVWTIPGTRMKNKKEHRVPLSDAAMQILQNNQSKSVSDIIFHGRAKDKLLSDMSLIQVLRRMGRHDLSIHGFRSTFRDWASERTSYTRDVCEMALAHTIGDKVEAAYRRGDLYSKRSRLMRDWGTYCVKVPITKSTIENV